MNIDIERLRNDIMDECAGAYFAGGFSAAMIESFDVERLAPEELVKIAQDKGIDLRRYIV